MKRKQFKFRFRVLEKDDWGNKMVECPVCGMSKKEDGILKHLIASAKKSEKYARFVDKHRIKKNEYHP